MKWIILDRSTSLILIDIELTWIDLIKLKKKKMKNLDAFTSFCTWIMKSLKINEIFELVNLDHKLDTWIARKSRDQKIYLNKRLLCFWTKRVLLLFEQVSCPWTTQCCLCKRLGHFLTKLIGKFSSYVLY